MTPPAGRVIGPQMKPFPTKDEIRSWIEANSGQADKRLIAKAFGIKGAARIDLKRILKLLEGEGLLTKERHSYKDPSVLAPVELLVVTSIDRDGDVFASPETWKGEGIAPTILVLVKRGENAGIGDRLLCKIRATEDDHVPYEARLIRKIGAAPAKIVGIFRQHDVGGRIVPVDKKAASDWMVEAGDRGGARDGELVEAELIGGKGRSLTPKARITSRLGDPSAPKSVSLIAIHEHGIPDAFPDEVLAEAAKAKPAPLNKREDLRHLPLFTIDPSDARDHDDAVCAVTDGDGWRVWVAIADVAHYVRPGSELDREARNRGNSTYFPDRVVPMLPHELSGDLCSLHHDVDRPCLAVEIHLSPEGRKNGHRFTRGLMRSPATLSYEQAQAAADGQPDDITTSLLEHGIKPLWAAYRAACLEKDRRQPLHLDLPERKVVLSDDGKVLSVAFRDRLDAHKLIEEFMILANVCAAETLEQKRQPLVYRVHEEPSPLKVDALRETVESMGLNLPKGQVLQTAQFNRLLDASAGTENAELVNMSVLRTMTQAYYAPQNFGHFGLNLKRYAHFTSPIRRYSDLIVHRALIAAHGWGDDGMTLQESEQLEQTAEHISQTERRSMLAERDTTDRYLAAYLAEHAGSDFTGRVSGIARFGLFVKLDETGADGLIPISTLGREYFRFDPDRQTLTGEDSRQVISLGMRARVRLSEATPTTGGLIFELLELEGKGLATGQRGNRRGGPKRQLVKSRIKRGREAVRAKRARS